LGHQNRPEQADRAFDELTATYRGVSASFVSWLLFERAAMWERAERPDRAQLFYRRAVERLPRHAHAVGHLAPWVATDEAERLLRAVVATSEDPGYLGQLAGLLRRRGRGRTPDEAQVLLTKAREGYARLLAKHPFAFADHAAWFHLSIDRDPPRAVELARVNLQARETPAAFELLVTALSAAGRSKEACEASDRGLAHRYPTRALRRAAIRAYRACGRAEAASAHEIELQR
jgi:hypothetical protein